MKISRKAINGLLMSRKIVEETMALLKVDKDGKDGPYGHGWRQGLKTAMVEIEKQIVLAQKDDAPTVAEAAE